MASGLRTLTAGRLRRGCRRTGLRVPHAPAVRPPAVRDEHRPGRLRAPAGVVLAALHGDREPISLVRGRQRLRLRRGSEHLRRRGRGPGGRRVRQVHGRRSSPRCAEASRRARARRGGAIPRATRASRGGERPGVRAARRRAGGSGRSGGARPRRTPKRARRGPSRTEDDGSGAEPRDGAARGPDREDPRVLGGQPGAGERRRGLRARDVRGLARGVAGGPRPGPRFRTDDAVRRRGRGPARGARVVDRGMARAEARRRRAKRGPVRPAPRRRVAEARLEPLSPRAARPVGRASFGPRRGVPPCSPGRGPLEQSARLVRGRVHVDHVE